MTPSYTTGTKTVASAALLGTALADQIRDDIVAHAAWDLVEEFTPSGGAVNWCVLKNDHTVSGLSADFYIVIGRTISTGEIRLHLGEAYNSSTHVLSKFAHQSASTSTVTYDSSGCTPGTFTLGTTAAGSGSNGAPIYSRYAPTATTSKYWVIAYDDGIAIAFNGTVTEWVYIGAYTPLCDTSVPLPLILIGSRQITSNVYGAVTRNPAVASATAAYGALCVNAGGANVGTIDGTVLGFRGTLLTNDALMTNKRTVAEMGINIAIGSGGGGMGDPTKAASCGYLLGKHKHMRITDTTLPGSIVFGDAYALDGTLWVQYGVNDYRIFDTGVPV